MEPHFERARSGDNGPIANVWLRRCLFCWIAAHFEGITGFDGSIPTPRFQLEAGFSATRVSDAFMSVQSDDGLLESGTDDFVLS